MLIEVDCNEVYERVYENFADFIDWVFYFKPEKAIRLKKVIENYEKIYNENRIR